MDDPRDKRELWFYALAFVLALALRLVRLGAFPLTDGEALPALQALKVIQGLPTDIGPNSAYVLLTSVLFFLFEGSNFFARLIPALAGSFLVFAPLLFSPRFPWRAGWVLAFFLAVDPGLLAISRQAGSNILAITAVIFAWGLWVRGSRVASGIFAAVALLSGPSLWAGILGLALAWAISESMQRSTAARAETDVAEAPAQTTTPLFSGWKTGLLSMTITLVLLGTFIFLIPRGISGALMALVEYVRGWAAPSSLSGGLILRALIFYEPLAILLAVVAAVRGLIRGEGQIIRMVIWLLIALLLAVFYPAHQVQDLAWVLLPLLALAALELSRHFEVQPEERFKTAIVMAGTVMVLAFAWIDFAGLASNPGTPEQANLRLWLFFGALFLLAIGLVMVAIEWSSNVARLGAVWGVTIFFALFTISAGLAAGRLRANHTPELWESGPYPGQVELVVKSVSQLSQWSLGQVHAQPVTIYQSASPALQWALRAHELTLVDTLDPASAPPILITPFMNNPGLNAAYRGQDFSWNQTANWATASSADWLRWTVLREMPQSNQTIMLWVRDDLFLDGSSEPVP